MTMHFFKEVDGLKKQVLSLCAMVEENLNKAVRSIEEQDADLAMQVIEADSRIDEREVEVEEESLKILALHQPVAIDLRFIIAVLKINNDLERIGDLAVNIAERSVHLCNRSRLSIPVDFEGMTEKVRNMLKKSIDALVNMDADLAREVCKADDEVDEINRQIHDMVIKHMEQSDSAEEIDSLMQLLSVARQLERIADHATNIGEDLIYTIEARIIRHHADEP
ncbi:MAG: phosphate signaling complex protein PhoU [Verrucomicrobiota bacterium]